MRKKSWLEGNVAHLLSIIITVFTFILFMGIIFLPNALQEEGKDVLLFILGAMSAISTQIYGYYFGSSTGSKTKQEHIHTIHKSKHNIEEEIK